MKFYKGALIIFIVLELGILLNVTYAENVGQPQQVFMNGVSLTSEQVNQLQSLYHVQIVPGRFWYDNISGLWGVEGGASLGQMLPGLNLGGSLNPEASVAAGTTQIFINGRELHPTEIAFLQRLYGPIYPGRYWLDNNGIGGLEGGPAIYNLGAAIKQGMGDGGRSQGLGHSFTGSVIGDQDTVGYIGTDGTSVSCGGDGGCIYN